MGRLKLLLDVQKVARFRRARYTPMRGAPNREKFDEAAAQRAKRKVGSGAGSMDDGMEGPFCRMVRNKVSRLIVDSWKFAKVEEAILEKRKGGRDYCTYCIRFWWDAFGAAVQGLSGTCWMCPFFVCRVRHGSNSSNGREFSTSPFERF